MGIKYVKKGIKKYDAFKLEQSLKKEFEKEKEKKTKKYLDPLHKLSEKKLEYRQKNPIKSILKIKRGTVTIKNGGSSINLMKSAW
ncbi:MAG: hypothetical protein ACTSXD_14510 [Candidatus Heimdallarchaeaceae archaeon]